MVRRNIRRVEGAIYFQAYRYMFLGELHNGVRDRGDLLFDILNGDLLEVYDDWPIYKRRELLCLHLSCFCRCLPVYIF